MHQQRSSRNAIFISAQVLKICRQSYTLLKPFVLSVDGAWTQWSAWGECSQTCIGGSQNSTRTCTNPPKQYGGVNCPDVDTRSQPCGVECPSKTQVNHWYKFDLFGFLVDGGWADWEPWYTCSASCEGGMQETFRFESYKAMMRSYQISKLPVSQRMHKPTTPVWRGNMHWNFLEGAGLQ